jgi:DNA-binding CsgD family transcriptional regulator
MGTGRDQIGVHKDGHEFPVEIGLNHITTREGDFVVATVVDISERKRAEEESGLLVRAKAKIDVCEHLGFPAAVIQRDRRMLLRNQRFEKISSQFLATAERTEFLNPAANNWFIQMLVSFKSVADENIRLCFSIPETGGQSSAFIQLLPIVDVNSRPRALPLFVLILKPVGAVELRSVDALRDAFGLTLAEAKVAAHCAAGFRVRQTAERLGRSKETVRTQLARVFEKTGVSSQIQLTALLATLFAS